MQYPPDWSREYEGASLLSKGRTKPVARTQTLGIARPGLGKPPGECRQLAPARRAETPMRVGGRWSAQKPFGGKTIHTQQEDTLFFLTGLGPPKTLGLRATAHALQGACGARGATLAAA